MKRTETIGAAVIISPTPSGRSMRWSTQMETETSDEHERDIAGVIVDDGAGQYFAISWDDLCRFRVPPALVALVEALVHGGEVNERDEGVGTFGDTIALSASHALLTEAVSGMVGMRLATERLAAWVLMR